MIKKYRGIIGTLLSVLLVFNSAVPVHAATANDIFSLYNRITMEEVTRMQAEYTAALDAYTKAQADVTNAEVFNALYETAEAYQESKKAEIDTQIETIIEENKKVSEEIGANISGDWEALTLLEVKYKTNTDNINKLLEERSKYTLTSRKAVSYEELDSLSQNIEDMGEKYESVANVSELGDLSNIRYPLNADTYLTSSYGDRLDPMTGDSIRFHAGIDLHASEGTEVVSLFNGVIADTGFGALGGYYVKVDHGNGISTYYCHLSEIKCNVGDTVNQYDVIALSGNTGARTTGPHLHLGLYINGNSVDPEVLFER